jgi:2-keto-4-pentenoate hydratase/2-oxohepta-3-ene-1,7-dioic acid hydratase in catechol pathway
VSNHFYGPHEDVRFPGEEFGIDFEGEFGVIVDAVPMGTSAAEAMDHIRLIVQINDWSLRKLAGPEMKTGFGWVQAKPPCSMAPFAVTPDELGRSGPMGASAPICWWIGTAGALARPMARRWAMVFTNWWPMPRQRAIWLPAR